MLFRFFIISFLLFGSHCSCNPKKPFPKDTIVSGLDANIPHLDPIRSTNVPSSRVNSSIFEGLYHYHYLKRPLQIEPQLAKAMPEVSEKGHTYTIRIKKGVFFQDDPAFPHSKGRELVAQDFIYSWKRLADPKNKAEGWWIFDGLIKGLNEWRDKVRRGQANYETPVEGLKTVDTHTLKITLTRASFQFLHLLCMPVTMVVAKEVVNHYGQKIIGHPVGTGPYQLVHWVRNSEVKLKRNKNFRRVFYPEENPLEDEKRNPLQSAGPKLPLTENVIIKIITERQPLWLSFLKGQLDHGVIPKDHYNEVFKNNQLTPKYKEKGIHILKQYQADVTFLVFNMEDSILGKNRFLRQALAMTLDKELILKKFYNSRGVIAQGPVPPMLDAHNPYYKNPLPHDLEKAKKYLAKAGYPGGQGLPVFEYETPSSSAWSRQFAEFVKDQWAQIGVRIEIRANTWPLFNKKVKSRKAKIFDMAWVADYPDSENFLQLFYSKNISPGSNSSNFVNRKYDSLFEKAVTLPPGPERTQKFRELVKIINEEVPVVFIIHRINQKPFHAWLDNFNVHSMIFDFYQYLSIDEKKKMDYLKRL